MARPLTIVSPLSAMIGPEMRSAAQDAAHTVLGLGVLGFQKAQVRRQEIRSLLKASNGEAVSPKMVTDQLAAVGRELGLLIRDLDTRMDPLVEQLDAQLDRLLRLLVPHAGGLFRQVCSITQEARAQLRLRLSELD